VKATGWSYSDWLLCRISQTILQGLSCSLKYTISIGFSVKDQTSLQDTIPYFEIKLFKCRE